MIPEAQEEQLLHNSLHSDPEVSAYSMADDDDGKQDATAASSPASDGNNDANSHEQGQDAAGRLPKDRECVFCGQAFTSSSLGRHLDLYIKPKNPKPADGVHNVDEIRKIRGGITRRQPRNSLKTREDSTAEKQDNANKSDRQWRETDDRGMLRTSDNTPAASPVLAREGSGRGVFVNTPSWQSTGVINNIPPRAPSRANTDAAATGQAQRVQEMRRDTTSGVRTQRPAQEVEDVGKLREQAETGKAAEMALREIMGSLQAARRKIDPGPIYEDFDFFAQSFPGLCLNILPPPTTLFSPAPFASPESWSLKPPGQQQSEVMNRLFNERCREMRAVDSRHPHDAVIFRHSAHLQGAFENWRLMSDKDQQAAWTLEALRCFTTSRDTNNKLKRRLADAEQHASHLESQYDRLARCQLPREWLVRPPKTTSISSSIAREMDKLPGGSLDTEYDPETIISRWRETARSVTRPPRQSTAHMPNYAESAMKSAQGGGTSLPESMIMSGTVSGVGGPISRTGNTDYHRLEHLGPNNRVQETVSYETPPHPGTILDDDESAPQTASPNAYNYPLSYPPGDHDDDDMDQDISTVLDSSITNFVDRNALAKQKRFVQGSFSSASPGPAGGGGGGSGGVGTFGKFRINGSADGSPGLNANGKRPAEMGYGGGSSKGQRT